MMRGERTIIISPSLLIQAIGDGNETHVRATEGVPFDVRVEMVSFDGTDIRLKLSSVEWGITNQGDSMFRPVFETLHCQPRDDSGL